MNLVVSNPPKQSRRRKRRAKARIRRTLRAARQRRRAAKQPKKGIVVVKKSRRRRGGTAHGSRGFGLIPSRDTLTTAAAATGGFVAANWLANQQFVPASMRVGWARVGVKAGLTLAAAAALRRISPRAAQGVLMGGLVSVGLDVVNRLAIGNGVAGLAGRINTPELTQLRGLEDAPENPYGFAGRIESYA